MKLEVHISVDIMMKIFICDAVDIQDNKIYLFEDKKVKTYYPLKLIKEIYIKTYRGGHKGMNK